MALPTKDNHEALSEDSKLRITAAPPPHGVWDPAGGMLSFVETLYWNILDHAPESQKVVDDWTKTVYAQGLAYVVGRGIFMSNEYSARGLPAGVTVDKCYWALLGRVGEPAGKADWVARINSGWTLPQVVNGFVNSAEYRARVKAGTSPDPIHWPS